MKTLLFYSIFEIISLLLFWKAEYYKKKSKDAEKEDTLKKGSISIKKSTMFLVLSFIPIFLLVAFRNVSVGVDTNNYVTAFLRITNGNITALDEKWLSNGYILLCKIIGIFTTNNYVVYNSIIAFLTLYFFYKGIWENCEKPTLALFLFFSTCLYYQCFNQARQMLAISIVLYNFKNLKNNNLKKYLLYNIIAFEIHSSAIIMLPFYFLSKFKINKQLMIKYFLLAISIILFFPIIQNLISKTSYGLTYSSTGYFLPNKSSIINLLFRIILLTICFIFGSYTNNKYAEDNKLFNLCIWCILFQLVTVKMYIFGRITTYFYIAFLLLIPNIYHKINNKSKQKLFLFGIISLFIIYHIIYFHSVSIASGYDTYKFFFE